MTTARARQPLPLPSPGSCSGERPTPGNPGGSLTPGPSPASSRPLAPPAPAGRKLSVSSARQPALPGLTPSSSHQGALQQATGADAERAVEAAHRAAVQLGQASPLLRLDGGVRMGPGGRAVIRAKGSVDYMAVLHKGPRFGRALPLEVKAASGERFELRDLQPHQADALDAADYAGALALVVVVTPRTLLPLREEVAEVAPVVREASPAYGPLERLPAAPKAWRWASVVPMPPAASTPVVARMASPLDRRGW